MNVQSIKIADIDRRLEKRIRPVSEEAVNVMLSSIEDNGLQAPIEVRRNAAKGAKTPYILVSGAVRLAVADLLAWEEIDASIVDIGSEVARVREIDENLFRHDLTVLARAQCLAERKKIYDAERGETRGGDRRVAGIKVDKMSILPEDAGAASKKRFTLDVAERMGGNERSIQRWISLYNALQPRVVQMLAPTSIADDASELRFISTITAPVEQIAAVQKALEVGKLPSELLAQPEDPVNRELYWVTLGKKEVSRILKMDRSAQRVIIDGLVEAGVLDAGSIRDIAA